MGRPIDHDARHHLLVERIVADLHPVHPRWPVGVRLTCWVLLDLIVAAWVISHSRHDFRAMLERADYLLELLFFGGAALLAAHLALRSAVPGLTLHRSELTALALLGIAGALLLSRVPLRPDYPLDVFVRTGLPCAFGTTLFATAPWLGLAWAVARNAPMRGWVSGALVGAGAALFSFAVMRIDCRIDEPLHLFAWHVAPAVALVAASAILGGPLMRFRPSGRLRLDTA